MGLQAEIGMRETMNLVRFRRLRIIVAICIIIGMSATIPTITAFADSIGITDEFDGLEGDGKYLGKDYRDHYQLDVEKLGIKDAGYSILNAIANAILSAITFVGYAGIVVFYYALDFDIASLLKPVIGNIQSSLRLNLFLPIFQLVLIGAFILAIIRFARRDFAGLMGQFGKVIFIFILSILLVHDSATFLNYTSNITKSLSVQIMTGISGIDVQNETKEYATEAAGILWVSLVHEPWKALEFIGYEDYTDADVEFFLTETDQDVRAEKIKEIKNSHPLVFSKYFVGKRIGDGAIIFLTMLIKCLVYIVVAVILLIFQIFTIVLVLLAPIILLMALMPGYDFMVLGVWCRKLLEIQVGILVITFLMGIMVMMDHLIQGMANTIGWYIALILQVAVCIGLYFFRYEVLSILTISTAMVGNPRKLRHGLANVGNPYRYMERQGRRAERAFKRWNRKGGRTSSGYHYADYDYRTRQERPSRPDTYQTPDNSKPIKNKVQQEREQPGTATDIKSMSYYAPRDVTDNWRELWNNAEKKDSKVQTGETRGKRKSKGVYHREAVKPRSPERPIGSRGDVDSQDIHSKGYVRYQPAHGMPSEGPEREERANVQKEPAIVSTQIAQEVLSEGNGGENQVTVPQRPVSYQIAQEVSPEGQPRQDEAKVPQLPLSYQVSRKISSEEQKRAERAEAPKKPVTVSRQIAQEVPPEGQPGQDEAKAPQLPASYQVTQKISSEEQKRAERAEAPKKPVTVSHQIAQEVIPKRKGGDDKEKVPKRPESHHTAREMHSEGQKNIVRTKEPEKHVHRSESRKVSPGSQGTSSHISINKK